MRIKYTIKSYASIQLWKMSRYRMVNKKDKKKEKKKHRQHGRNETLFSGGFVNRQDQKKHYISLCEESLK